MAGIPVAWPDDVGFRLSSMVGRRCADLHRSIRYHDLMPLLGVAGIGATWDEGFGELTGAIVVDRQVRGRVAYEATVQMVDGFADPGCVMALAFTGGPSNVVADSWRGRGDLDAMAKLLPGHERPALASFGLRSSDADEAACALRLLEAQRAMARRAILAADMPTPMRTALLEFLDGSMDIDAANDLRAVREKAGHPCWEVLTTLSRIPAVTCVLRDQGMIATAAGPRGIRGAIADQWPMASEAHLRRLAGPPTPPFHPASLHKRKAVNALGVAFALPSEWMPQGVEWDEFSPMAEFVSNLGINGLRTRADTLRASRGDWISYGKRLRSAVGADDQPRGLGSALGRAATDCGDPATALSDDVVVPLLARRAAVTVGEHVLGMGGAVRLMRATMPYAVEARKIAFRLLYEEKSLLSIIEASASWHARADAIRTAVHVDTISSRKSEAWSGWPPLFQGPVAAGGLTVVPLHDEESLADEGSGRLDRHGVAGLSHCIASRASRLAQGDGHALSIRTPTAPDGSWRRLSTVEVRVEGNPGDLTLRVIEHRGAGNAVAPFEAASALKCLQGMVEQGTVEIVPEALTNAGIGDDVIARDCGYDWRSEVAFANAVEAWSPFLPRWARGIEPDRMLDALIGADVADAGIMRDIGWA